LPTALSLAVFHGWTRSLLIACVYLCLEIITANYVEPHIYGKHTGLSSLAILVAAAFWTLLWGPIGLVLSVPLTVCLVVMGRHVPSLEFLTVMLGDHPVIPAWTCFYQRLLARDEREAGAILEMSLRDKPLEEVYDLVLIPALIVSEEDRMHGDLEDSTVRFIRQTVRELVEESGFRENLETVRENPDTEPANLDTEKNAREAESLVRQQIAGPAKVICVPARDEADELTAIMLAQSLHGGPVHAFATPVLPVDELLATADAERPEIVFLCGIPPFGIARSRRLYRSLRAHHPHLKIMIGIWNYRDDPAEAAQRISKGEEGRLMTRLTEAVAEVRSFSLAGDPAQTPAALSAAGEAISNQSAA
jgi:hypothetical protein